MISGSPASLTLLVVTVAVSLLAFSSRAVFDRFALHPYGIAKDGTWYQTITSGFLHGDITHLAFNMITLFFFGPFVESSLGTPAFLLVYFGSMLAGSLVAFYRRKGQPRYRAIGASGAISGILFSFVLLRPLQPIYIFFLPVGIPAALFAIGYVAVSAFGMQRGVGRIGHEAHLGGAIAGLVLTLALDPGVFPRFLQQLQSAF